MEAQHLVGLEAQNFKKLKAISLTFDDQHGLVILKGKNKAGKCVPENSLVTLWDGSRKKIQDIRETDLLVGLDYETLKLVPENPLGMCTSGVQPVFEVCTRRGFRTSVTLGHRLLSSAGWKELKDLRVGDHLAVPLRIPSGGKLERDYRKSTLLGLLIGDGCIINGMHLTTNSKQVVEFVKALVSDIWPYLKVTARKSTVSNSMSVSVTKGTKKGKRFGPHLQWLDSLGLLGKNAYSKFIPEEAFSYDKENLYGLLVGLFVSDGYVRDNGEADYYSRSYRLVESVRGLLLRCGIPCSISRRGVKRNAQSEPTDFWRVSVVTAAGKRRFVKELLPLLPAFKVKKGKPVSEVSHCFSIPPDILEYAESKGGRTMYQWGRSRRGMSRDRFARAIEAHPAIATDVRKYAEGDVGWDKIVSISPVGEMQTFDLQMPSEAFLSNDFIVHNSSVLEAVIAAIAGKKYAIDKPVRDGEKSAKVVLKTEELIITHRWTARGGDALEVTNTDGLTYKSPQSLLNALIETIGFDPMEFSEMEEKKQTEELLRLCPVELDLHGNAKKIKEAETTRRDMNRDVKRLKAALTEYPDGECPEHVELSAISEAMEALNNSRDARTEIVNLIERGKEALARGQERAESIKAQIKELEEEAERNLKDCNTIKDSISEAEENLKKSADPTEEMKKLHEKMKEAQETNAMVSRFDEKKKVEANLESAEEGAKKADDELQKLRATRADALKSAKFPVDGLSIDDEGVVCFNGNPLSQASSAEQTQVGVSLAAAANPKLKIAFVRHGSLLDKDSMKILAEMAKEKDLLVLVERVDDDSPAAIHIVDGEVKKDEKQTD